MAITIPTEAKEEFLTIIGSLILIYKTIPRKADNSRLATIDP